MSAHSRSHTAHHNHARTPGQRLREQRKRKRIIFGVLALIAVVLVVWGLSRASYAYQFKIKDIAVTGAERVGQKWLAVDADTHMNEPLFGIFSRHNSWLVPERAIEKTILARPEIASVEVDVDGDVLRIDVVERSAVLRVCGETCFDMDDQGMLFAKAPDTSTLVRVISNEPSKVTLGAHVFSPQEIAELQTLIAYLATQSSVVRDIRIDTDDEISLFPERGAYIKAAWKTLAGAPEALATILASKDVATTTLFSAEYIDVRFENSVYFK